MIPSMIHDFLKKESSGGLLLIFAAVAAMILANSPLSGIYDMMLEVPVAIQIGELVIAKPKCSKASCLMHRKSHSRLSAPLVAWLFPLRFTST